MITKYYKAEPVMKEALCDKCKSPLKFLRSDFSRPVFSWLHACEKCGQKYWLDNRYPLTDYLVDMNRPLDINTDPIVYEEYKE